MGNFTESQILILALIAASNVILIIVAVILLYSGRKQERSIPKTTSVKTEPKKIVEYFVEEDPQEDERIEIETIEVNKEPVKVEVEEEKEVTNEQINIDDVEEFEEEEIDYENYTVPNGEYSDEEYKYSSIEEFENAQEESAIISYQELIKLKNQPDEYEEPIEVEKPIVKETKTYNNANYGTGEFISPVFGRMKPTYNYTKTERTPIAREEKVSYNSRPMRHEAPKQDANTEFLNALKEFRNNL